MKIASGLLKNLSATAFSTISGMVIQAATAPLYLTVLDVHTFSVWLLATAVGSYVSLTLNGLFYSLMNEVTISVHRGDQEQAQCTYDDGISLIFLSSLLSGLFALLCFSLDAPLIMKAISIAVAIAFVNLSYVLFDANFRATSSFALGSNVLSLSKFLDWAVAFALVAWTRNITTSLFTSLIFRAISSACLALYIGSRSGALAIKPTVITLKNFRDHIKNARSQLLLAATSASSAMGPQIVISAVFPGAGAVSFNIYRTYMRLLASVITTGTAAAWPIVNRMYANGEIGQLSKFVKFGVAATTGISILGATVLYYAAPYVFPILFKNKIEIDYLQLFIVTFAVVISTITIFLQSLYISTNAKSASIYLNFGISVASLFCLYITSLSFGLLVSLLTLAAFELASMSAAAVAAQKTLKNWATGTK